MHILEKSSKVLVELVVEVINFSQHQKRKERRWIMRTLNIAAIYYLFAVQRVKITNGKLLIACRRSFVAVSIFINTQCCKGAT